MKKYALLGAGVMLVGILAWWGMQSASFATHNPNAGYDPTTFGVGYPNDEVDDETPDRPGADRDNDRSPDRGNRDADTANAGDARRDRSSNMDRNTPGGQRDDGPAFGGNGVPDRVDPRSTNRDNLPDCFTDGPGDGNCSRSQWAGDDRRDNFGAGDGLNDRVPDRPSPINRPGDNVDDYLSDRPNSDRFLAATGATLTLSDRTGIRDCAPADVAQGECDDDFTNQIDDGNPDRTGREGTHHDNKVDNSTGAGDNGGGVAQAGPGNGDGKGMSIAHGGGVFRRGQDRVGAKNCAPADVARGECDKPIAGHADDDFRPDRDKSSANGGRGAGGQAVDADRVTPAYRDSIPDGTVDRDHRDSGFYNHDQTARSASLEGPQDYSRDGKSDHGGLGFALFVNPTAAPGTGPAGATGSEGAEGSDGDNCSFSPAGRVNPMNAMAYLLILISPVAIVAIRRWRFRMKKLVFWGAGMLLAGAVAWLGMQDSSFATHNPNAGYDPVNNIVGAPNDEVDDDTPDHPGADKSNDRSPDRAHRDRLTNDGGDGIRDRSSNMDSDAPSYLRDDGTAGGANGTPDRVAPRSVGIKDHTPDCGNGPGDGNCGNSPNAGDDNRDNFGAGDAFNDKTPDRPIAINRIGDNVDDSIPDRPNKDRTPDRHNARDCVPADLPGGECDDNTTNRALEARRDRFGRDAAPNADWTLDQSTRDNFPDRPKELILASADNPRRPGRDATIDQVPDGTRVHADSGVDGTPDNHPDDRSDGTPDQLVPPNRDGIPDGNFSRPDRDSGRHNHNSPSRDAYPFGPHDNAKDNKSDHGGLGFAPFQNPTTLLPTGPTGADGGVGSDGDDGCSFSPAGRVGPMNALAYLLILLTPVAIIGMRKKRFGMKRWILLSGMALALGLAAWLGMQNSGLAGHNDPNAGYDPVANAPGHPQDDVDDETPDVPGADRDNDRTPDRNSRDFKTVNAGDGVRDRSPNSDQTPDAGTTGPDRAAPRSTMKDNAPDCGDGPGDDECGNSVSDGDEHPDNFGAGDDISDEIPDRPIAINRIKEGVKDGVPDNPVTDRYLGYNGLPMTVFDRVNARDCNTEDLAAGECDRNTTDSNDDGNRDRIGRGGAATIHDFSLDGVNSEGVPDRDLTEADNPNRPGRDASPDGTPDGLRAAGTDGAPDGTPSRTIPANRDRTPDGDSSRGDRDRGRYDHTSASRDAFDFGPGDRIRDKKADEGGLGFAAFTTDVTQPPTAVGDPGPTGPTGDTGGKGDDGCSFSPESRPNPMASAVYFLILIAPLALVRLRRSLRR